VAYAYRSANLVRYDPGPMSHYQTGHAGSVGGFHPEGTVFYDQAFLRRNP